MNISPGAKVAAKKANVDLEQLAFDVNEGKFVGSGQDERIVGDDIDRYIKMKEAEGRSGIAANPDDEEPNEPEEPKPDTTEATEPSAEKKPSTASKKKTTSRKKKTSSKSNPLGVVTPDLVKSIIAPRLIEIIANSNPAPDIEGLTGLYNAINGTDVSVEQIQAYIEVLGWSYELVPIWNFGPAEQNPPFATSGYVQQQHAFNGPADMVQTQGGLPPTAAQDAAPIVDIVDAQSDNPNFGHYAQPHAQLPPAGVVQQSNLALQQAGYDPRALHEAGVNVAGTHFGQG